MTRALLFDVEAGYAVPFDRVLRCGGNDPASLNDADAVYSDPADLVGALDTAPFAWPETADASP